MQAVFVEICVGTSCYLLGSQDLLQVIEMLPEEKRKQIHLTEATCFPDCRKGPTVRINGDMLSGVTPEYLLAKLDCCLR